jgi:glycine/D-amino acid oxidase-like deaminating enzyme/nitrite reductase/ring-hydroxylating ferredoxin subunit
MHIGVARDSAWPPILASNDSITSGENVDVCVVGAGISGLSVAYELSKAGKNVLVVDRGPPGGGQTCRTTAHLASAIDDRYFEIERIRGEKNAKLAAASHIYAIDAIERTVREEEIDCAFERVDGYLFVPRGESTDVLDRELEAARRAGLEVETVSRAPIAFDTGPCLRFTRQGQIDPSRYLEGLRRAIRVRGGRVASGVRVAGVSGWEMERITLGDGRSFTAGAIVIATGTPIVDRIIIHDKQSSYTTYVVALEVRPGTVPHALFWDTGDPYHYVRVAPSRGGSWELLLVGGEDHRTGQAHDHDVRFRRLEAWARTRFPFAGDVAYRWSGQVFESADGLGFIGKNPDDRQHVYVVTGDSGMGMTHGTIAGRVVTDLILGRGSPWRALYDPARKVPRAISEIARDNANAIAQYGAWLSGSEVHSVTDIPNGEGRVVRRGLGKLAVYKDDNGRVTACSAVCPHLRAIVSWNDAEKTWDCPAHGSRYTRFGKVICGPANEDLKPAVPPAPAIHAKAKPA